MKSKLDLAHEYAMKHLVVSEGLITVHSLCGFAWDYADEMYKQLEERESKGVPEAVLKGCNSTKLDWQPDWSQAPEWANWWVVTFEYGSISKGWFFEHKPIIHSSSKDCSDYISDGDSALTESFGYIGDWKDSLRKRPEGK